MVGNGATNWDVDVSPSFPETITNFNMAPTQLLQQFNDLNCTYYFNDFRNHSGPAECDQLWEQMNNLRGNISWYDLYRNQSPLPTSKGERAEYGEVTIDGETKRYKRGLRMSDYTPWLRKAIDAGAI